MTFEPLLIQNWRPFRVSQYTRGWCVTTETGILFSLSMLTSNSPREPYFIFFTYSLMSLWTSFFLLDIIFVTGFTLYRTKTERKKLTIKYIRSNAMWETIILLTPSPPLPPPPLLFPLFFHIFINPLRLKWQKNPMLTPIMTKVLGRKETSIFKIHDSSEIFYSVFPFLKRYVEIIAALIPKRSRWRDSRWTFDDQTIR